MNFKYFLPAILANVAAAFSEILLMASSAWLIASSALHPPLSTLSIGITLVRTAGISRAALRYADRFISHKIIFRFLDDLRGKLFLNAAKLLPMKSGRAYEGEFLHSMTVSADLFKDFLPRVVLPLSTAAFVTILLTYFLREPLLPLIFIANVILAAQIEVKAADDSSYREKILDFNDGRDELNIFGVKPALKRLNESARNFGEENFKLTARQINFDTAFRIFNAAGLFFMLMKVADIIALTVWTLIFLATLEIFNQIPSAIRTLKKISPVKFIEPKNLSLVPSPLSLPNNAVEIKNLNFGYSGEKIFDDFNLNIERGEKLAIVGESGSGKTTLLYLLTKLFAPDSGTIAINGKIAASTFTNYIFSSSIRYNFEMLNGNITEEKILAALKTCGLENFDIDIPIGEDGANLSGGERNRLQIALALASEPDILLLDEPTAGLDKICAEKLVENLILATKNRTLIIITHDSNYFSELGRVEIPTKRPNAANC